MASAREGQGGMSKFKVGDRVKCTCGGADACTVQGRVVGIEDNGEARVACDNGEDVTWRTKSLALVAPAPPVAVAPTLETATGVKWLAGTLTIGVDPAAGPDWTQRYIAELARLDAGREMSPISNVTKAEWSEAQAQLDSMRAALDKVRVFFASHRFESLGVAAGREMREVMGAVLRALDSDKAGK